MTWGVLRPVIMIPETYVSHPDKDREFVLRHECQHLRQHDTRWLALAQGLLCLHWVNPLAWLALKRLRLAQEKACDEAVVFRDAGAAVPYADFLLRAAKESRAGLFQPLALAVVPPRQNALKQRLTNILTPTMKTEPSKRLHASLIVLVTTVCLTLALLGWRSPGIAHETSDPDLQQKLESKVLESVELNHLSVEEALRYLRDSLEELDVNVVLLRGALTAFTQDNAMLLLERLLVEQEAETEAARLEMLDVMERYHIAPTDEQIQADQLELSERNMLQKQMEVMTVQMRIEKLSGLHEEAIIRLLTSEIESNPLLDAALTKHTAAQAALAKAGVLGIPKDDPARVQAEQTAERCAKDLTIEVNNLRSALHIKLDMAQRELEMVRNSLEKKRKEAIGYGRKARAYNDAKAHYDRQQAALDTLKQRQLDARINRADEAVPTVTLSLRNSSLADTMTYALQLAGLDYRLRKNTIVIGTAVELEDL